MLKKYITDIPQIAQACKCTADAFWRKNKTKPIYRNSVSYFKHKKFKRKNTSVGYSDNF